MEAVTFKTAYIQKPAPAKRGSRLGNDASDLASLGLHLREHGFDSGRNGDRKRFASSTLGAGEGKHTVFKINAVEGDLCFTQTASRSQGNFKADSHPFRDSVRCQGFPGDLNLIIRKHWFNSTNRAPFNSVIKKGNRIHLSKQSALPVNPFKNFQVLAGLVASSLSARGAWKILSPSQINFAIICRKRLQGKIFFGNKALQMTPRVQIVRLCQRGNWMIFNQIINPAVAALRSIFGNAKASSFSVCLCAMKCVVDSKSRRFASPLTSFRFVADEVPRRATFNVTVSHGIKGNICVI